MIEGCATDLLLVTYQGVHKANSVTTLSRSRHRCFDGIRVDDDFHIHVTELSVVIPTSTGTNHQNRIVGVTHHFFSHTSQCPTLYARPTMGAHRKNAIGLSSNQGDNLFGG